MTCLPALYIQDSLIFILASTRLVRVMLLFQGWNGLEVAPPSSLLCCLSHSTPFFLHSPYSGLLSSDPPLAIQQSQLLQRFSPFFPHIYILYQFPASHPNGKHTQKVAKERHLPAVLLAPVCSMGQLGSAPASAIQVSLCCAFKPRKWGSEMVRTMFQLLTLPLPMTSH